MTKYLIILILLISSYNIFGQNRIIDAQTKKPVSYGQVKLIHQAKGAMANYNGYFKLDTIYNNSDTFKISCIGYESKFITYKAIQKNYVVDLSQKVEELNEVIVTAKKVKYKNKKIGVTKKPRTQFFDYSVTAKNGEERAIWIPNEYNIEGHLKSINVYVTDVGYPDAHFRIHVYNCSMFKTIPGEELTSSNIISSGTIGNEWVNVNLENQNIIIGENGCFIGIEWFDSPKSLKFNDTLFCKGSTYTDGKYKDTIYSSIRKGNGIVLGSISEKYKYSKNKLWVRRKFDEKWDNIHKYYGLEKRMNIPDTLKSGRIMIITENNYFSSVPCINIEVAYPKGRIKTIYKEPKKRKLNRIEKVKEDNFKYPQARVSELFFSLGKTIENDDIIYALKYLFVYKKDELDMVLNDLNIEKGQEVRISEKDKTSTLNTINNIQEKLEPSALTKIKGKYFELKIDEYTYTLIIDNGLWKICPYTYKVDRSYYGIYN